MKKLLTLFALGTTTFAADLNVDEEKRVIWGTWKDIHSKKYSETEELIRLNIFHQNRDYINAHNANPDNTVTLGINHFADLTADEFRAQYASGFLPRDQVGDEGRRLQGEAEGEAEGEGEGEDTRLLANLPAHFDWREKGAVSAVKNQGKCGACWAFSATGTLESLHFIKTGKMLSFSEQQLINCDKTSHGCKAGVAQYAMEYAAQKGIELESAVPYKAKDGTCNYIKSKTMKVNSGYKVVKPSPQALMTAILAQPVSVGIEADQSVWQFYKSGVITANCGKKHDHFPIAVGWTTVNGHQAFIVKNSWGAHWGNNGYAYISTSATANGGAGVCGILTEASYPTS